MTCTEAVKTFFERKGAISPDGGRKIENAELMVFAKQGTGALRALGTACAKELGVELDPK